MVSYPLNPNFWGVKKQHFQAKPAHTWKVLKVPYYRKYCTDSNQILQNDKDLQVGLLLEGGINTRPANRTIRFYILRHCRWCADTGTFQGRSCKI